MLNCIGSFLLLIVNGHEWTLCKYSQNAGKEKF